MKVMKKVMATLAVATLLATAPGFALAKEKPTPPSTTSIEDCFADPNVLIKCLPKMW